MYNSLVDVKFKENLIIIAEFQSGEIKEYDFKKLLKEYPIFSKLSDNNIFFNGYVSPNGSGLIFNEDLDISSEEIYENGTLIETKKINSLNVAIANIFSKARIEKGISQKDLSLKTGIHQAEISKIERGIGNPSIKTLERIAKGLGLNLELFLK